MAVTKTSTKKAAAVVERLEVKVPTRSTSDVSKWRSALSSADRGKVTTLYDLYEDLTIDGVVSDATEKRIQAVTNSELIFQDDNGEEVPEMHDLINSSAFEELLKILMKEKFWGRAGAELSFDETGMHTKEVPVKHINLHYKVIATNQGDDTGYDYTTDSHLIIVGNKTNLGIYMRTSPYAIFKRGGFGDYAQWLEMFGMPQRIGKYNAQDLETKALLEEAFINAGSAPWMVAPKETEIETVNNTGNNGSGGTSYNDFRKACNEEILITILGQTMTTVQGDKGARALGEVHKDVEEGKNRADMRYVQRVLNDKLVPLLQARGYKATGKFVFPQSAEDLTVDEVVKLSEIMPIPTHHLRTKYAIPEPRDGEPVAQRTVTTTADPEPDPPAGKKKVENSDDERKFFMRMFDFFADASGITGATHTASTMTLSERISGNIKLSSNYKINVSKLFKEALKTIYAQAKAGEEVGLINQSLFDITNEPLQQAFTDEFGKMGAEFGKTNKAFINEFNTNGAVFAAFKNHQQTKEIVALLVDDKGALRSFSKFSKAAQEVGGKYNMQYLQTEYNTAVRGARSAANYKKYQETADLYPNLEYMESTSANKRDSHLAYVGTILPIDDPWWDEHMPPSDWNCGCWVRQTDAKATSAPDGELVDPLFANNPGKDAEFLKLKDHPYVKACSAKEQKAVRDAVKSLTKK